MKGLASLAYISHEKANAPLFEKEQTGLPLAALKAAMLDISGLYSSGKPKPTNNVRYKVCGFNV